MADIEMPQLGETVTEGTITKWFKAVGDRIEADEPLFEVSTDKVDSEVPSTAAGFLSEILVQEGETVDVGTRLAVVSDEQTGGAGGGSGDAEAPAEAPETAEEVRERPAEAPAAEQAPAPPETAPESPQPAPAPPPEPAPAATQEAPAAAPEPPLPAQREAPAAPSSNGGSALLSPVVRRLIAEHDLDPAQITGTGMGGRITRSDVLQLVESQASAPASPAPATKPAVAPAQPAPAASPAPAAQPAAAQPAAAQPAAAQPTAPHLIAQAGARDEVEPFTNIRRRTAEHMVMSHQVSPHAWEVIEVDFEAVDRVRRAERETFKEAEGFGLTYLPFVCRAVTDAIAEFPHVNASVGENALVVHGDVHLGIAVDLDFNGLLVPVIHSAGDKRLRALAREIRDLATRAHSKQLSADDITGGTFTISNPGPFGTMLTMPIINQPQVAILSTDGVKRRPVVVEGPDGSEAIAIHSVGHLVLGWDHRAFDGAYAAAFLHHVAEILATRDWAAEL